MEMMRKIEETAEKDRAFEKENEKSHGGKYQQTLDVEFMDACAPERRKGKWWRKG